MKHAADELYLLTVVNHCHLAGPPLDLLILTTTWVCGHSECLHCTPTTLHTSNSLLQQLLAPSLTFRTCLTPLLHLLSTPCILSLSLKLFHLCIVITA